MSQDNPFTFGEPELFIAGDLHNADALSLSDDGELIAWMAVDAKAITIQDIDFQRPPG